MKLTLTPTLPCHVTHPSSCRLHWVPAVQEPEREANHSLSCSTKVQNVYVHSTQILIVWCLNSEVTLPLSESVFSSLQLPVTSPTVVRTLVAPIVQEFSLTKFRLLLAGSSARVNPDADVSLLEGDILIIEDANKPQDPRGGKET